MNFIKKHWMLLIIIISGLTPILWFEHGFIIARGDFFPSWFNALASLRLDTFVWSLPDGGNPSTWPAYLLVEAIWYVFRYLQIPINAIQIIFQIFYFMGAGISMYLLISAILKKRTVSVLLGSLFYMFNLFTLQTRFFDGVAWTMVFLPLLLAIYVKVVEKLESGQSTTKYGIYFVVISTVLLSFASINLTLPILSIISLLIFFVYYLLFKSGLRLKLIKNLVILGGLVCSANIWWVIPTYLQYFSPAQTIGAVTDVTQWSWTVARASFLNLLQLNGFWSWTSHNYPYINTYSNSWLILLCFFPLTIAFSGMLFKGYIRRRAVYGCVVVVLGMIFLQKGLHQPLANINLFLYQHIPYSSAFRTPTDKFGLVLIIFLALLIGFSSDSILQTIQKIKNNYKDLVRDAFVILLVGIFLVTAFPLFTMKEILAYNQPPSDFPYSAYVTIPNYWYEASDWINNQAEDGRILMTPNQNQYGPYSWGYYGPVELPKKLITKPILQTNFDYVINANYSEIMSQLYDAISKDDTAKFQFELSLLNVRYILQCNDVEDKGDNHIIPAQVIKSFYDKQLDLRLMKVFGPLDLYEVDSVNPSSHIYVPSNISLIEGGVDKLLQADNSDRTQGSPAIFLSGQVNSSQIQLIEGNNIPREQPAPKVSFQQINPVKYNVTISGATEPFFLVFSENFDPQWRAYASVDGHINWFQALFYRAIPNGDHFVTNGYANAWYVDPGQPGSPRDFTITLYNKSQSYFYLGCLISGITIIGCFIVKVLYDFHNRH